MTVLFADLVGFTTLSEHRDPEEVRELLSRYFDHCRVLIDSSTAIGARKPSASWAVRFRSPRSMGTPRSLFALEEAYALRSEAAIALGDDDAIADLVTFVEALPPARAAPLLRVGRDRLAAEQAHRRGDAQAAEIHALNAIALLRSVGARPLLARLLIEHGHRRDDKDALAEARAIYSELGASRWLSRAEELDTVSP